MALPIKGLQKLSLIDYPGKLCATVFVGECNFRCVFCYNIDLVLRPEELATISEEEALVFLSDRKNFLDGICVSGGEPTIHMELPLFLSKVKALGYLVKVDTNGSRPDMLKRLIEDRLVDYIAMDVKAPLKDYERIVRTPVETGALRKSVHIIRNSNIDYELRTTVVPGLVGEKELIEIAREHKSSKRFVIQQFRPGRTLDECFKDTIPYPTTMLEKFCKRIKSFFKECELRY